MILICIHRGSSFHGLDPDPGKTAMIFIISELQVSEIMRITGRLQVDGIY